MESQESSVKTPIWVVLVPIPREGSTSHATLKNLYLHVEETIKIGRKVSAKSPPTFDNGIFDSRVLSRHHADIWADSEGKVFLRDAGSSNGTFVNSGRLSAEGTTSQPFEIKSNDRIDFGVDIMDSDGKLLYARISCNVFIGEEAQKAWESRIVELAPEEPSQNSEQAVLEQINREIALATRTNAQLQRLHEVVDYIQMSLSS